MNPKLRSLLMLAMLAIPPLQGEPKSHAKDFGDPRFQDFDYRNLVTMEPRLCLKKLGGLRVNYLYPDGDWPKRPEMVEASRYWAARNPQLADYFQERSDSLPVLFENYSKRRGLKAAADFPAEWAVRFLARLAIDETRMTSNEIDFTNGAELEKWIISSETDVLPTDNAHIAMVALRDMKLHGGGPASVEGDRDFYGENYLVRSRANARTWWSANEHRIPEIVKATWGERAVLNADIGLGPDNKPLVATGLAPPGTRPRKAGNLPADPAGAPEEQPPGPASGKWIPIAIASAALAIAVITMLRRKAAAR